MIRVENISKCGISTVFDSRKDICGTENKVNVAGTTSISGKVLSVLFVIHQVHKPLFLTQGEETGLFLKIFVEVTGDY